MRLEHEDVILRTRHGNLNRVLELASHLVRRRVFRVERDERRCVRDGDLVRKYSERIDLCIVLDRVFLSLHYFRAVFERLSRNAMCWDDVLSRDLVTWSAFNEGVGVSPPVKRQLVRRAYADRVDTDVFTHAIGEQTLDGDFVALEVLRRPLRKRFEVVAERRRFVTHR